MKFLPPTPRVHGTGNATSTQGMDAALTVALFLGVGFLLDRWLGTTPVFMVVLTVVAAIGFFAKFKYRYDADMSRHEAELAARRSQDKNP